MVAVQHLPPKAVELLDYIFGKVRADTGYAQITIEVVEDKVEGSRIKRIQCLESYLLTAYDA